VTDLTSEQFWHRELTLVLRWAEEQLTKPDDQLLPMSCLFTDTGDRHAIAIPTESDREEKAGFAFLAIAGVALVARGATHVSEAWKRVVPRLPGETYAALQQRAEAVPPSEAEDRVETVIASAVWRDDSWRRHSLVAERLIERAADGTPHLGPIRWENRIQDVPILVAVPHRQPSPGVIAQAKLVFQRFATEAH